VLELRREFLFQRFLARIFADPTSPSILKGATGQLVCLPGPRYSRDIDLRYPMQSLDLRGAVEELRIMTRTDLRDHLNFVIDDPVVQADGQTLATLGVTGYTGATRFDRFSVDLSTELHVVGRVERLRPKPVTSARPNGAARVHPLARHARERAPISRFFGGDSAARRGTRRHHAHLTLRALDLLARERRWQRPPTARTSVILLAKEHAGNPTRLAIGTGGPCDAADLG